MTSSQLPDTETTSAANAGRGFFSPLLIVALLCTGAIAIWGLLDAAQLAEVAKYLVNIQFASRAWFIMLAVSFMLLVSIWLAFSRYGSIRLGGDDDRPEFSTISWLTMLFAAGMGVGLLFWGSAEPLTHFELISSYRDPGTSAGYALFITNFHWGLHAWAIYALTGLVFAYFGFRRGVPGLIGAPILATFGHNRITRPVSWLSDLMAIVAIAIGVGGSIAMGVFQVQDGIDALFGLEKTGGAVTAAVFIVLCIAYFPPLVVDLSSGMAKLSNAAMGVAAVLMLYVLLAGPTHYIMSGIVQSLGEYFGGTLVQGFRTYTFLDQHIANWFSSWTLTYMVWWIAWAPFVGVFIARISRGRTIREFICGVILGPTLFSILWFGVFGGAGFNLVLGGSAELMEVVRNNVSAVTFYLLGQLPLSSLTILLVVIAAFLFIVTSVVSAAFVLGMFSTGGDMNPSARVKLSWGVVLGALGVVMILSGNIEAIKSIIALGALPFVFVMLLLVICLLKTLQREPGPDA